MTFSFGSQSFSVPDAQWPTIRDAFNLAHGYDVYINGDDLNPPTKNPLSPDAFCLAQFETYFKTAVANGIRMQASDATQKQVDATIAQLFQS